MAVFSFELYLQTQKRRVEALLARRMDELAKQTPGPLLSAMRYSLLGGGKRLRPILCLAFAEAGVEGGGALEVAEDAAAALELIHTYSLIHDDLPAMDNDDLRRGQPTCHRKFGEAMAILAGDALLTEAFFLAARGEQPERREIVRLLAQAAGPAGMVAGQALDIDPARPDDELFLDRMHRLKTGALIQAACVAGAICSGSTRAQEAAKQYGESLGIAFQIADDLLDVTGKTAEMGKQVGGDASAGRRTFAAVAGVERGQQLAQRYAEKAIEAIQWIEPEPGPLMALARFSVERRS